jgi:hypothetical protein
LVVIRRSKRGNNPNPVVTLTNAVTAEIQHCIYMVKTAEKYMYAKLTKAVYGTLLGAIQFYDKLSKQLIDWEYEPNCYDRCTFNKMIDGNQITIQFHVGDLKISHLKQMVIDSVLADLNNKFGTTKKPLSATTGHVHDYLGITIDYSEIGKVKFTMYDYLEDILDEMPDDMNGTAPTAASDNLFDVNEDSSSTELLLGCYLLPRGRDQIFRLQ